MCLTGPIVFLANGNLNGRVIRLVADHIHRIQDRRVRVIAVSTLNPLNRWPDERTCPHAVEPECVSWAEADGLVRDASVFVLAPFWDGSARRLAGAARRAGTPVVCVVADVGSGARKLDVNDESDRPDRICVADPITRSLLVQNGIPDSIIRNAGSPYFDSILARGPLPPPPRTTLRVALLANPTGMRARLSDRGAEASGQDHDAPRPAVPWSDEVSRQRSCDGGSVLVAADGARRADNREGAGGFVPVCPDADRAGP